MLHLLHASFYGNLHYCTIVHLLCASFYGDASMCSAHFFPIYEKSVEETQLHRYFRIFQPSAVSPHGFSPHFFIPGRIQACCTVCSSAEANSCFFVQIQIRASFYLRLEINSKIAVLHQNCFVQRKLVLKAVVV